VSHTTLPTDPPRMPLLRAALAPLYQRAHRWPDGRCVMQMATLTAGPRGSMGEEVEPTWLERANAFGRAYMRGLEPRP
jgi:hypothetical protein